MSVRTLTVAGALLLIAGFLLAARQAQDPEAHQPAQTPEQMKQHCEMMTQHMQEARARMEDLDKQLDAKLAAMREARGEAKVTAMAAVIEELVGQRHSMHDEHMRVMHGMMMHMGEHAAIGMEGKAHEAMMQCPMMQMHGAQHQGEGQHQDAGQKHGNRS